MTLDWEHAMRHWFVTLFLLFVFAGCTGEVDTPLHPDAATETAPNVYKAKFETTKGDFVIQVDRNWAPLGADRFYNLVKLGYYDNLYFFRVINGFMAQVGIHADPQITSIWKNARILDDPVTQRNTRGRVSFATAGPRTRTTQFFINFNDQNVRLDGYGFAPFGEVVEGMDVVDRLHSGYGEGAPGGTGPAQDRIQQEGNPYLEREFPKLAKIVRATILSE